ncbi:MAG: LysM peptidoglycan-binding domain-containing protein, partial [Bacteroidales bacterium]|nr:LysM peptidoglycan-binding domain-containing protein [Bacteroidales bacterium]
IVSVLIIVLGVLMYLKDAKENAAQEQNSPVSASGEQVAIYDVATQTEADSVAAIYGLQPGQIEAELQPDGRRQMRIPVRKIHTVRPYDNLETLQLLYGVPKEKIIKVNGLKGGYLDPAREIIIPL